MKRRKNANRVERLNAEFKKDVYEIITKKLKNPLISEMFSITKMDVTNDLSCAKVYVSIFSTDEEKKKTTFCEIKNESKRIRHELAKISNTRTVPELTFILDDSMEYGDKMEKLFKQIKIGDGDDEI